MQGKEPESVPQELSDRLPVGPAEESVEKMARYQAAGAQRIFMWPLDDQLEQLDIFRTRVASLLPSYP